MLEEQVKKTNEELKQISIKLVEIMDERDELSFKTSQGTFYQSTDLYAQVTDKELIFGWLKKKHFFSKLARVDINTNTLKAWIKERMKDNKEIPIDGINCYYETTVRFRKESSNKVKDNKGGN